MPLASKEQARNNVRLLSSAHIGDLRLCIRLNALTTVEGILDLAMLAALPLKPASIMLSKVASPVEISIAQAAASSSVQVFALVESVNGLNAAGEIAAHPSTRALIFGTADFAAEVGCSMSWEALLFARSRMVMAASSAGKSVLDGVWPDIDDDQGLIADTKRLGCLGFAGRLAIHPRQVPGIHSGLLPSSEDVLFALAVVSAFESRQGNATQVNGRFVDQPIYESALLTLERAGVQGGGI